jgi:hypothetical protein
LANKSIAQLHFAFSNTEERGKCLSLRHFIIGELFTKEFQFLQREYLKEKHEAETFPTQKEFYKEK